MDHVACTYASLEAPFESHVQLKAQGVLPYRCVHHGVTVSMYYADPEGNQMEFQVDSHASNEEANACMEGPHFCRKPDRFGVRPEDWVARLRAGVPASQLLRRQVHLPVSPIRGAAAS